MTNDQLRLVGDTALSDSTEKNNRVDTLLELKVEQKELSVVIPCLDEAETIGEVVAIAMATLAEWEIDGEVVVADNGSTDNSQEIARAEGARVVRVPHKGYGNALMGGIQAARGKYIIMGDADGSYDFREIPNFLEKLRAGHGLVQGCRLPSGGGTVAVGAMPPLHYWVGNPVFSFLARRVFGAPIHDINCGLRGFSKEFYQRIDQRCTGMEFAVEMVLKGTLFGESIAEVPIILHPDKRITKAPHLCTFRDGWRTLRFYLMCSPRWLFLVPGIAIAAMGALVFLAAWFGVSIGGSTLALNTALIGSLFIVVGYQAVLFAVLTKIFAIMEGFLPYDRRMERCFEVFTLERALIAGGVGLLISSVLIGGAVFEWWRVAFGTLAGDLTLRVVAPAVLIAIISIQTVFSSFFMSILGLKKR